MNCVHATGHFGQRVNDERCAPTDLQRCAQGCRPGRPSGDGAHGAVGSGAAGALSVDWDLDADNGGVGGHIGKKVEERLKRWTGETVRFSQPLLYPLSIDREYRRRRSKHGEGNQHRS